MLKLKVGPEIQNNFFVSRYVADLPKFKTDKGTKLCAKRLRIQFLEFAAT
jgi:hypothetical protein